MTIRRSSFATLLTFPGLARSGSTRLVDALAAGMILAASGLLIWTAKIAPLAFPPLALLILVLVFRAGSRLGGRAMPSGAGQERLRLALENAEEGLWDWDIESDEMAWNERWMSALGHEPGTLEPTFQTWLDLIHPEDVAGVEKALDAHLARRIPSYQTEHRVRTGDGEWRFILARGRVVERDVDGRALRMSGTHRDITERKSARAALLRHEALLRAILENAADGMVIINHEGRIESFNNAAEHIFGYRSAEVVGRNVRLLMPSPDSKRHDDYLRHFDSQQKRRIIGRPRQVVGRRSDGSTFPMELSIGAVEVDGERIFSGIVRDITARKEAEENLKLYRAIVENMSEGVQLIRTRDGVIVYANPTLEQMFEYQPGELAGSHVSVLYAPEQSSARDFARDMIESLDRKGMWRSDVRSKKKSGELFWCRTRISTFDHPKFGRVWVSAHEDISDLVRAEAERRQLEEQLRQAHKMESLGQLAGGVAHDFNNLLVVISGHLEFAREAVEEGSPAHSDLLQALGAADRAAGLTRQLLAFSRRQVLNPSDVTLDTVVENLLPMLRTAVAEHIEIDFNNGDGSGDALGTVHIDVGQVEQVILNLCVNARDAMPGGGQISIHTRNVELDSRFCRHHAWARPGHFVELTISDSGHGMSETVLAQIFEPFFTTKDPGTGTGLGLAMVQGVVRQHDALIDVESRPGGGSVFRVFWPRVDREVAAELQAVKQCANGGDETLLLAEDDDIVRDVATRILEHAGYRVLTAPNGREAVRIFEERFEEIDLVILDLIMPVMGGMAAREEMLEIRPETRFLLSSGYSEELVRRGSALEIPLAAKPYQRAELLHKVREAIESPLGIGERRTRLKAAP